MTDLVQLVHITATRFLGRVPPEGSLCVHGAQVLVEHDGNEYAPFFNPAYGNRTAYQFMARVLERAGYYAQQRNAWQTTLHLL